MQIISGRIKKPFAIVVFGIPGIGKSTFASHAPSPIFLGAEENDELDVNRLPMAKTFEEFNKQLDYVLSLPIGQYKTVVIDTIDSVEKLLHRQILNDDPKAKGAMGKAHGGYGKAYEIAETEMLSVREKLKTMRDQMGMNVILLAHSKKRQSTDTILGFQHDTYELTLHERVQNVFVDWVSAVLFANYVTYFKEDVNSEKMFASGEGERLLLTEKRPGHLGKNRYSMPYKIALEFSAFEKCYNDFFNNKPLDPNQLRESIMGACELLQNDAATYSAVINKTGEAGDDVKQLQTILNRVLEITKGVNK
jgi:hypothetical protein